MLFSSQTNTTTQDTDDLHGDTQPQTKRLEKNSEGSAEQDSSSLILGSDQTSIDLNGLTISEGSAEQDSSSLILGSNQTSIDLNGLTISEGSAEQDSSSLILGSNQTSIDLNGLTISEEEETEEPQEISEQTEQNEAMNTEDYTDDSDVELSESEQSFEGISQLSPRQEEEVNQQVQATFSKLLQSHNNSQEQETQASAQENLASTVLAPDQEGENMTTSTSGAASTSSASSVTSTGSASSTSSTQGDFASQQMRMLKQSNQQLQEENEDLRSEIERLKRKVDSLKLQIKSQQDYLDQADQNMWKVHNLELSNRSLNHSNQLLSVQNQALMLTNADLEQKIKERLSDYHILADREQRLKSIQSPYFEYGLISCDKCPLPKRTVDLQDKATATYKAEHTKEYTALPNAKKPWTEIEWLGHIIKQCQEYGFVFPERLIYAFHTSLKIAEWSPLTVLAGVSGTGKSELPRLYSLFGGLNFINLPVQPSWDSQEAMLGYFNTLDNKFDAQPVLRLLSQSQTAVSEDYRNGMQEATNLVLLDEMNLAHVELYFADFLSKFEERRGRSDNNLPELEVKLGAGVDPYKLPLGRNVMWVGTMNQDETTKSLSDKVIDRGVVIHFPRPKSLVQRKQIKPLPQRPLFNLPYKFWKDNFVTNQSTIPENRVKEYKLIVEEINQSLGNVGRALGHRVWQSVEAYLNNYPTVRAIFSELKSTDELSAEQERKLQQELDKAFEDQLVQKVMPKLRGIETKGKGSKSLSQIRELLTQGNDNSPRFRIVEDFDLACTMGYGQFMWNSANYLNNEEGSTSIDG